MMRRQALVYVGEQDLVRLIELPEGLRILGIAPEFMKQGIALLVEGDSLEEVPDGFIRPELYENGQRWRPKPIDLYQRGYNAGFDAGLTNGQALAQQDKLREKASGHVHAPYCGCPAGTMDTEGNI